MTLRRDDLLDAGLASLAAGTHVAMAFAVDRFPPGADLSLLFVGLPPLLSAVAAVALLVRGERRPLLAAAVLGWLVVLFTLPAQFLGLAWLPSAVLLTIALQRPRLGDAVSSGRAGAA